MTQESACPDSYYGYEMGPIRPPSEADSLLIRVTRNCAWNRCTFCPVYKGSSFSIRPLEHVLRDIDLIYKNMKCLREAFNEPSSVTEPGLKAIANTVSADGLVAFNAAFYWFMNGMKSVFLQDSDALASQPSNLIELLRHLKERFPWVERVTSYSRSSTLVRIADEDLEAMRDAGLNRIHVGLESGSDKVLKMVKKGASKEMHIRAGLKVKNAGIELSEYAMPGLGGTELSAEHALETADALNQIDPDFIRLRTLAVTDRAPLGAERMSRRFHVCSDIMIVNEIKTLIQNLHGIKSVVKSDHVLNLFGDLEGKMPQDRDAMLEILDAFLGMEPAKQDLYRIGRRLGVFSGLKDLMDTNRVFRVEQICLANDIRGENMDSVIDRLLQSFI